jgi:hypothetical protein
LNFPEYLVLYCCLKINFQGERMEACDVVLRKAGEGRGYYERCGAEAGIPALSRIFAMMSEDELHHAEALRAQQAGAQVELPRSVTVEGARFLLRSLALQHAILEQYNGDLSCLDDAMAFEAASVRFYGRRARESQHRGEQELYLKIAAEDEMHFTLLEHMRELLESVPVEKRAGGVRNAN